MYSRSGAYTVGIAPLGGSLQLYWKVQEQYRRNSNHNPQSKFLTVKILANFLWWIAIET